MIKIRRWAVGRDRESDATVMRFEFADRAPLQLLVPKEQAEGIARAIMDHYAQPMPANRN